MLAASLINKQNKGRNLTVLVLRNGHEKTGRSGVPVWRAYEREGQDVGTL
jgi:hypothetical protein